MNQFAMLSPLLIQKLKEVPPCARQLHQYLLAHYPAGRVYEINIDEYADLCGCCVRYIRTCLHRLFDKGIVEEVHRYSASEFKVIAHDERTFDFAEGKKRDDLTNQNCSQSNDCFQKQASNPDSVVTNNREEFRDNRDTLPLHPVEDSEQKSGLVASEVRESKAVFEPVSEDLRQKLRDVLQQPLNKNILAVLIEFSESRARDALDALREAMRAGNVKNPAGWFISAIRNGYKPNHTRSSRPPKPVVPEPAQPEVHPEFPAWFEVAVKAKVAIASGYNDQGELMVYGKDCAEPFEQARQTWPLEKLQEMVQQPAVAPGVAQEAPLAPEVPVPSDKAVDDERQRRNALARLKAKFDLPWLKAQAIQEAKLWGFEVTGAGIFEVAF